MKRKFMMSLCMVFVVCMMATAAFAQTIPAWQPNTTYATGALVTFNGQEYQCIQGHTSQVGWEPPNVPALWQLVAGAADFSLSSTSPQTVTAGNSTTFSVTASALNGFNSAVSLSISGLPSGVTASFSPASISGSTASTVTISTTANAAAGTVTLTITGTSGGTTHTVTVTLTVNVRTPDFALSSSPASQTVADGGSVSYTISSAAVNGFNSAVALTISGLPNGATATFSPASISGTSSSTLTVSAGSATPSGTSTLTITGKSGALTHTTAVSLTVGSATPTSGTTTGTIHFHLLLGVGNAQDSLTLDGDNFTDLIMSNMIAGVMYGHLIQEYVPVPGVQFNKDYLYGSVMGQLLQENLATQDYLASGTLIDPSPDQQAVMSTGQGGPYQINNYAVDLVAGGTAPAGHSLINYIAVQKNIGFTIANASNQFNQVTPPSFNNKFYGPMLPAFFHYNDFVSLNVIGKGAGAFTPPWQPQYDKALANFVNLPNSFLDIILNEAYNQGYFGGLVAQSSTLGATATAATVASVNSYSTIFGNTSTFAQYPYQVHFYLDQMYDNPIPSTSATTLTTPTNHIIFNVNTLEGVFSNVFQTLSHSDGTAPAQFFTAAQAQAAFSSALSQHGVASSSSLDLSNAANRATIFAVIDSAIGNLENAVGMKFNATTTSQL
ncbi:MAG TPA: carbohydrate-binding protein [Candidatus Angelobacter sp.]|nr:carbohydrate-binding protein [Candidatus Angelobacter sp.]